MALGQDPKKNLTSPAHLLLQRRFSNNNTNKKSLIPNSNSIITTTIAAAKNRIKAAGLIPLKRRVASIF